MNAAAEQGYPDTFIPEPRRQHAFKLQRKGLTLTEISERMGLDREVIVDLLYTQLVQQ
jgi:hypothetical protein